MSCAEPRELGSRRPIFRRSVCPATRERRSIGHNWQIIPTKRRAKTYKKVEIRDILKSKGDNMKFTVFAVLALLGLTACGAKSEDSGKADTAVAG